MDNVPNVIPVRFYSILMLKQIPLIIQYLLNNYKINIGNAK